MEKNRVRCRLNEEGYEAGAGCRLVVGGEGHKFYPEARDVTAPEVEGQRGDER